MASQWYFQFFGEELGPISASALRRYAEQGSIDPETLVRKGESGEWLAAGRVRGLFASTAPEQNESATGHAVPDPSDASDDHDLFPVVADGPVLDAASTHLAEINLETAPPVVLPWWRNAARRLAAPWGVSTLVHAAVLLVLGLWLVPLVLSDQGVQALVSISDEPADLLDALAADQLASVVVAESAAAFVDDPTRMSSFAVSNPELAAASDLPTANAPLGPLGDHMLSPSAAARLTSDAPQWRPDPPPKGTVTSAEGVDGAVDGVTASITGRLGEGDTLVVWLFDASLSLFDDRQEVVRRLEPFYDEIGYRKQGREHTLTNAVVTFGRDVKELVRPTQFSGKVLRAIQDVPIDQTGLENVMSAVEFCVKKYRKRWDGGLMIVVWTDESGDDILRLEPTIELCQDERVQVSVVGPSAVLGSERGTHLYTDPGSGLSFLLPVKRGPDTSLPERLFLPYWHEAVLGSLPGNGAQVAQGAPWYGGPHRERLLSGFGPFALTRLAIETGGTFTLLDRPGDRGPYRLEDVRPYMPDYRSAEDYLHDLQYHPLRQAVAQAVQLTFHESLAVPPALEFNPFSPPVYPYIAARAYQTPTAFRDQVYPRLEFELRRAEQAGQIIEQALARFGDAGPDDANRGEANADVADADGPNAHAGGMEAEYEVEKSPRWRAWYDLTRGRLLAASVRYAEYALTCREVRKRGYLGSETNYLVFHPVAELRTSKHAEARAIEALRLLTRCIEQNPNTPWSALAEWELNSELGLLVEQIVIPRPPPAPVAPASGGGASISLPNL